jgi:hypothetical protein
LLELFLQRPFSCGLRWRIFIASKALLYIE